MNGPYRINSPFISFSFQAISTFWSWPMKTSLPIPLATAQGRYNTFAIGGTGRSTSLFPGKPRHCRMCSLCFYKKLIQPLHTLSMVGGPLRIPSPDGIMLCYVAKTNCNKFSSLKQATQILFHGSVGRSPTSLTSLKTYQQRHTAYQRL